MALRAPLHAADSLLSVTWVYTGVRFPEEDFREDERGVILRRFQLDILLTDGDDDDDDAVRGALCSCGNPSVVAYSA
ncbi:hypothetical protein Tco_0891852 [Tanacetum coccineum]|uniref:Uncharacterized protein n=1 Tax=Tanacetum coccineum TaxID=301880 RepID=A0ABQ5C465_9ASTR